MICGSTLLSAVAPFTGAWIEIGASSAWRASLGVAPFTGAWIEIGCHLFERRDETVAPFTGAWIEILDWEPPAGHRGGHSLHGSVD